MYLAARYGREQDTVWLTDGSILSGSLLSGGWDESFLIRVEGHGDVKILPFQIVRFVTRHELRQTGTDEVVPDSVWCVGSNVLVWLRNGGLLTGKIVGVVPEKSIEVETQPGGDLRTLRPQAVRIFGKGSLRAEGTTGSVAPWFSRAMPPWAELTCALVPFGAFAHIMTGYDSAHTVKPDL